MRADVAAGTDVALILRAEHQAYQLEVIQHALERMAGQSVDLDYSLLPTIATMIGDIAQNLQGTLDDMRGPRVTDTAGVR